MSESVTELIDRVHKLVEEEPDWFIAVAEWYGHAQWSKRYVLDRFLAGSAAEVRLVLSVNDRTLDESSRSRGEHVWQVHAEDLEAGDNEVILWIDNAAGGIWTFGSVTVEQGASRERPRRPPRAGTLAVSLRLGTGFRTRADHWSSHVRHDTLKFRLFLADPVPEQFTLGIVAALPGEGRAVMWDELWELIDDLVKDKIKELARELDRLASEQRGSRRRLEEDLEDLKSYQRLHRVHLAELSHAEGSITLESVIARTETPPRPALRAPLRPRMGLLAKLVVLIVIVAGVAAVAWLNGWIHQGTLDQVAALWKGNLDGQPAAKDKQIVDLLKAKGAQGGDVQVSLHWVNKNDLDLHVITPSGERIFHGNRTSKCGGRLDVDMNVIYDEAANNAIENIFWPAGAAPRGRYKIIVNHFTNHGRPDCQDPTAFTVRLAIRGHARLFPGEVIRNDPKSRQAEVHEFEVR